MAPAGGPGAPVYITYSYSNLLGRHVPPDPTERSPSGNRGSVGVCALYLSFYFIDVPILVRFFYLFYFVGPISPRIRIRHQTVLTSPTPYIPVPTVSRGMSMSPHGCHGRLLASGISLKRLRTNWDIRSDSATSSISPPS